MLTTLLSLFSGGLLSPGVIGIGVIALIGFYWRISRNIKLKQKYESLKGELKRRQQNDEIIDRAIKKARTIEPVATDADRDKLSNDKYARKD